jgi:hypothetical protein
MAHDSGFCDRIWLSAFPDSYAASCHDRELPMFQLHRAKLLPASYLFKKWHRNGLGKIRKISNSKTLRCLNGETLRLLENGEHVYRWRILKKLVAWVARIADVLTLYPVWSIVRFGLSGSDYFV